MPTTDTTSIKNSIGTADATAFWGVSPGTSAGTNVADHSEWVRLLNVLVDEMKGVRAEAQKPDPHRSHDFEPAAAPAPDSKPVYVPELVSYCEHLESQVVVALQSFVTIATFLGGFVLND